MLLIEISNAISANERMELSADSVMNEHVEPNTVREELYPADGSSMREGGNSSVSVESNVTLDESVQVFSSDVQVNHENENTSNNEEHNVVTFQMDGAEGQSGHEVMAVILANRLPHQQPPCWMVVTRCQ